MKLRISLTFGVFTAMSVGAEAWADTFVNPLDTVPSPNAILGIDHSVTMGINEGCTPGGCHPWIPRSATRLNAAKQTILNTMPLIDQYFVFGGFSYRGCGYAEITNRVIPDPLNPQNSYDATRAMLGPLVNCGSREHRLPGNTGAWSNCITHTPSCVGDPPFIQRLLANGLPGMNIPRPRMTSTTCGDGSNFDVRGAVAGRLSSFRWPRWDRATVDQTQVQRELCDPLQGALDQVRTQLSSCLLGPDQVWDMTFLDSPSTWCDAGTLAPNVCTGSTFVGTCVCNQNNPNCITSGGAISDCGVTYSWKARQQIAVCELYNTNPPDRFGQHIGSYFSSQPDNIVQGGGCRENVGMLFTDGYAGDSASIPAEAAALRPWYRSASGLENLFVFRISDHPDFQAPAQRLQQLLSGYIPTGDPQRLQQAFLATDAQRMQTAFARVLSRVYQGVYTGTSLATDSYQSRAYFTAFTVPGYHQTGPVSDDYLGWPQRVSAHEILADGSISPRPIWESDWAAKVGNGNGFNASCNSMFNIDYGGFGPGTNFGNRVDRWVTIPPNSWDRDGDGNPDPHPALRWGNQYGFASTKPLVVEAPRELIPPQGTDVLAFNNHMAAVRNRPRTVYTMGNGYVLGFHGGRYQTTPGAANDILGPYGVQRRSFDYDDSVGEAGSMILAYKPTRVGRAYHNYPRDVDYRYEINHYIQQPILDGELEARELYHQGQWKTVLIGNSGRHGNVYFVLDITDPCNIQVIGEWTLPRGDRASNEPKVYYVNTGPGAPEPMLIVTGGLRGSGNIYAYRLHTTGTNAAPAFSWGMESTGNTSYSVAPICVDARGEGFVTHCYAVRTDGHLSRVRLGVNRFDSYTNLTPRGGPVEPIGNGRLFYTVPAVFFDTEGVVNLVYGSGNFESLTTGVSRPNYMFKLRDEEVRKASVNVNTRADISRTCAPDPGNSGSTSGVIQLPGNQRLVSSPVVVAGGVFWTTVDPTSNGCVAARGYLYGMDYQSCQDLLNPANARPQPQALGDGIPLSPVVHRATNRVFAQTTAGPTATQTGATTVALRRGGQPYVKRLYWRPVMDNR